MISTPAPHAASTQQHRRLRPSVRFGPCYVHLVFTARLEDWEHECRVKPTTPTTVTNNLIRCASRFHGCRVWRAHMVYAPCSTDLRFGVAY